MPIPFSCPHCNLETLVDDEFAGETGQCAGCNKKITVPYIDAGQSLHNDEIIVGIAESRHRSVATYVMLFVGAVLAGLAMFSLMLTMLFPAIGAVQAVAHSHSCTRNLQRIADALEAYEAEHGSLPPARVVSEDGVVMHSWRVLILPQLGEDGLYGQYNFTEPWDSVNNKELLRKMPAVFACPSDPDARGLGESNYMVIVGRQTLFPGTDVRRRSQVGDDLSETIMVAESPVQGYPWTEPRDLNIDQMQFSINGPVGIEIGSNHIGGAHVMMADGKIRFLSDMVPADYVRAMTTMSGGEAVPTDLIEQF